MATDKKNAPNIDQSDLTNYPNGRIRDNTGAGDGTPVNRLIYSDLHEFFAKLMRLAEIAYNGTPDNELNGFQLVAAVSSLVGRNDFVYDLNTVSGQISINTKISVLQSGETLLCKANFNLAAETQLKGSGVLLLNITAPSAFKTDDYILLIRTGSGVTLQRLADANNINALAAEFAYLKGATDAEEFAGASLTKATTPYTNQLAFSRRVNGLDSAIFLASAVRNGLLSAADKIIIDSFVNPVKNVGWFSGVSPGSGTVGVSMPRSGDITTALQEAVVYSPDNSANTYVVTLANAMANINYFVRCSVQSDGAIETDNDIAGSVFKIISTTQFRWSISAKKDGPQNLKIHLEVVQIP